jgi:electron transfer flavoprotein alpha subunit
VILVFVEHEAGTLRPASQDALAFARGIAAFAGGVVDAVAIGDGGTAADVARSLSGVNTLHALATGDVDYAPAAWAQALAGVVGHTQPKAVMAAATDRGQEILAYLGAKMALPMIANGLDVEFDDELVVTREQWGGAVHEKVRCSAAPLLMSVAPTAVVRDGHAQEAASDVAAAVEETASEPSPDDLRVRLARTEPAAGSGIGLPEARLVVSGGRGVGGPAGFAALEDLAGQLGAAIGVSRAVTSAGWRPHGEQVGQTGVRIAPDLYIACGVSGASQHMVGCLGAKRILAINTDAEAPIMARADYAVVGDLHQVVPAIAEEIRARRGIA